LSPSRFPSYTYLNNSFFFSRHDFRFLQSWPTRLSRFCIPRRHPPQTQRDMGAAHGHSALGAAPTRSLRVSLAAPLLRASPMRPTLVGIWRFDFVAPRGFGQAHRPPRSRSKYDFRRQLSMILRHRGRLCSAEATGRGIARSKTLACCDVLAINAVFLFVPRPPSILTRLRVGRGADGRDLAGRTHIAALRSLDRPFAVSDHEALEQLDRALHRRDLARRHFEGSGKKAGLVGI